MEDNALKGRVVLDLCSTSRLYQYWRQWLVGERSLDGVRVRVSRVRVGGEKRRAGKGRLSQPSG